MANRLITAATIISLLTPLAACGTVGGGLALEPEHQVRTVADSLPLPVYDLKTTKADGDHSWFRLSTRNFDQSSITQLDGFELKEHYNPYWVDQNSCKDDVENIDAYVPQRKGASLIMRHIAQWTNPADGSKHQINAKITYNDGLRAGFTVERNSGPDTFFGFGAGQWDMQTSQRPYSDISIDLSADDGTALDGFKGTTGFTDLDGGVNPYNEGVELLEGFDGAYVRSDAHLSRYGSNGWAGNTDENAGVYDEHGMKHYLGATFSGTHLRIRYSVAVGQARGMQFRPVDSTIVYPLYYDMNGGTDGPKQRDQ